MSTLRIPMYIRVSNPMIFDRGDERHFRGGITKPLPAGTRTPITPVCQRESPDRGRVFAYFL